MKQRKHPYGYAIRDGVIAVDPKEEVHLRWIFEAYASGRSYQELADALAAKGIPYCGEQGGWNKNVIARLLQNDAYLGGGRYPAILDENQVQAARGRLREKVRPPRQEADVKSIRERAVCAACGHPLKRHTKNPARERWYCGHCGAVSPKVSDEGIKAGVAYCLDLASGHSLPPMQRDCVTADIEELRLKNEVGRGLEHPNGCGDRIRDLILELAVKRYELCSDEDYLAQRLSHLFYQRKPIGQFDPAFFEEAVQAVLVRADGAVSLRLKSGQLIHNDQILTGEEQQL